MFDFTDKALDQMTLTIAPCIVVVRLFGILPRRNDRLSAARGNGISEMLRRIAAIRQHVIKTQVHDHICGLKDVVALACSQTQTQRIAQSINCDVDFGAEPAPTAPQRLVSLTPLFFYGGKISWVRRISRSAR